MKRKDNMKTLIVSMVLLLFSLSAFSQSGIDSIAQKRENIRLIKEKMLKDSTRNIPIYKLEEILSTFSKFNQSTNTLSEIPLNNRKVFTYIMIHYEDYMQNCGSLWPRRVSSNMYLYSYLNIRTELQWSKKQLDFLKNNRDSILVYSNELYNKQGFIGSNLKEAIVESNLWEMIPVIIKEYNQKTKDFDLITTLNLLMKNGNYSIFERTYIYERLYGETSNYGSRITIGLFDQKIIDKLIQLAQDYYKLKKESKTN